MADSPQGTPVTPKVVLATTVALSFISLWRAAAVILGDLASTMFYVEGIAEQAIGKSAPWMILGVMLFSFAIRWIYVESCSMYVRGGVYVVVRDSLGPFPAKLSVSALVVDYVLTGPISSVSAGHYLAGLINDLGRSIHLPFLHVPPNLFAAGCGLAITAYFWWMNTKGIPESSHKALRILQITTVMVVIMLLWAPLTMLLRGGAHLPPAPTPENFKFGHDAKGWLEGTGWPSIPLVAVFIAFGHTLLALSGFETLAQVYREIGSPKLKNLKRAATMVCVYALLSTGLLSLFVVMLVPDDATRAQYYSNPMAGLTMALAGPYGLRLAFRTFVVIVGALILSSGVNTSIIGANGILNRVAEDEILHRWFRRPHPRFGTSYRLINLIVIAQVITILLSRGDVYILGEAYAFGVVWSFTLKGVGVLALRFQRHDQGYKTPLNPRIGGREWPVGLGLVTLFLFLVAVTNLFTKQVATIYGVSFTIVLFALFGISERLSRSRRKDEATEEFNLVTQPKLDAGLVQTRPGSVLVAVRDYHLLLPLKKTLEKTNIRRHDIVVLTVRQLSTGAGEYDLREDQIFSGYEKELFTRVVREAEKEGKHVELLVVPATDPFEAMVRTAAQLQCARLVTGVSPSMAPEELARRIGLAWERLPEPRHPFSLELVLPGQPSRYINLGPHPPRLWPEDVERAHDLWLRLSGDERLGSKLHHRDVVGEALRRFEAELGENYEAIIAELRRTIRKP